MTKTIYKVQKYSTTNVFLVIADNLTQVVTSYPEAFKIETLDTNVELLESDTSHED